MKRLAHIALWYAAIAAIATTVNIGCQAIVVHLYGGAYAVPLSVLIGTGAGLPIKYVLEKRWIFSFQADDLVHDGRLFLVYTFFGIFTTALFWGIEYAFDYAFATDAMRYVGAALGLSLGYWIKYHLDKRFVFVPRAAAQVPAA